LEEGDEREGFADGWKGGGEGGSGMLIGFRGHWRNCKRKKGRCLRGKNNAMAYTNSRTGIKWKPKEV